MNTNRSQAESRFLEAWKAIAAATRRDVDAQKVCGQVETWFTRFIDKQTIKRFEDLRAPALLESPLGGSQFVTHLIAASYAMALDRLERPAALREVQSAFREPRALLGKVKRWRKTKTDAFLKSVIDTAGRAASDPEALRQLKRSAEGARRLSRPTPGGGGPGPGSGSKGDDELVVLPGPGMGGDGSEGGTVVFIGDCDDNP